MSFKEFSKRPEAEDDKEQRVHTIVSFLALLELVREGILDALQNDVFEDITINKLAAEIPSNETL
jgi:chromatin segregation and condensation protein Rec8/ScpA/Scc1 (kleisin family)